MKKSITLLTALAIVATINTNTFAAGEVSLKDKAGVTPDSIMYKLDCLVDSFKIKLSKNGEAKIKLLLNIAQERLGESQAMAEEGNEELAKESVEKYEENMQEAEKALEEMQEDTVIGDESQDDKDLADEENAEDTEVVENEELEEIEDKILENQKNSIEVLKIVKDKVSENAQDVIAKVIEMQTQKVEAMTEIKQAREELKEAKRELNTVKDSLNEANESGDDEAIKLAKDSYEKSLTDYNKQKEELKILVQAKNANKMSVGQLKKEEKKLEKSAGDVNETKTKTNTNTKETPVNNQEDSSADDIVDETNATVKTKNVNNNQTKAKAEVKDKDESVNNKRKDINQSSNNEKAKEKMEKEAK
ncbi:DUF5667 domain-containing protein [Clostridium sp. HMP27]|uniref:DUF5667 domain-containing protein n=1 Tax=Clostridium sp. HMP27 TaxID=1487921 RepID=UPI00052D23D1|nr:DUF5667 domain-containing protein [Clostridium sp. HMP27]KGK87928.1 hypothetical protein DP68_08290 [Clostridium sp. HMP27]